MLKAFLTLHLSILIAGWTGIFGRLIDLSAGVLVFWRVLLAALILWAVVLWRGLLQPAPLRSVAGMCAAGALLMLSWVFFYAAIKASNVSVGVVAFSSVGFFTALLEPLLTHRRINAQEVFFSLVTVAGIALIFHFDTRYRLGILFGLATGLTSALLSISFRGFRARCGTMTILSWELVGALLCALVLLAPYRALMPPEPIIPSAENFALLLVFASVCTVGMYYLQVQALEKISAFTVNLSYNLEPVYSILLAMALFGEARELNWSFWAGLALIALSVLLQSVRVMRLQARAHGQEDGRTP